MYSLSWRRKLMWLKLCRKSEIVRCVKGSSYSNTSDTFYIGHHYTRTKHTTQWNHFWGSIIIALGFHYFFPSHKVRVFWKGHQKVDKINAKTGGWFFFNFVASQNVVKIQLKISVEKAWLSSKCRHEKNHSKNDFHPIVSKVGLGWQLYAKFMSWVGCLLTDSELPDTWKLREITEILRRI